MEWKIVERDFIERTLALLEQYDKYVASRIPDADRFEVTLLVNCLIGLLVFPYEHSQRDQKPGSVPICKGDTSRLKDLSTDWGIDGFVIESICDFDGNPINPVYEATLRQLVYRMRNCIAHTRFYDATKSNGPGIGIVYQIHPSNPTESTIEKVVFREREENRFKATIRVENLRVFAETLAKTVLEQAALIARDWAE